MVAFSNRKREVGGRVEGFLETDFESGVGNSERAGRMNRQRNLLLPGARADRQERAQEERFRKI
jgi:hypothetical protein